jgi:D-alanyl-D-alanine carboxypeptidase
MTRARGTLTALLCASLAVPADAGPALLFDAGSGKVLYAEDQDHQWYPASLTKIMTAYLTFAAVKAGKLALDTKIPCSEAAHAQPPSKVGLPVGAEMTVDMALQALVVKSANDVAVMLAEAVAGNTPAFVEQMNATARRLGMTRSNFANPNGLPALDQVTTARDLAKLSQAVMRDFPEFGHYWALADMRLGKRRLGTHNGLLKTYEGADGLKTGFICDSGFNVVASATRDGRRLIAVVLGEPSGRDRAIRAASLLEHGFQSYGWKAYFNSQDLDDVPMAPDAKDVASMRESVVSWECGARRPRANAKTRQRARATRPNDAAAKAGQAIQDEPDAPAANAPGGSPQPAAKPRPASTRKAKPAAEIE